MRGAVVLTFCSLATACLITNCPKGGKRSLSTVDNTLGTKIACLRCGPGLQGRCLGPAVCCGPRLGCLVATPGIVRQCAGAAEGPSPHGKPCIAPSGPGVCGTDGVCCNSGRFYFPSPQIRHVYTNCEISPY
uniref:Uncharacterized protein n=1 Tax=Homalodisca liturata TaxID=320908 RepID=A0A1B6JEM3_9HEMI